MGVSITLGIPSSAGWCTDFTKMPKESAQKSQVHGQGPRLLFLLQGEDRRLLDMGWWVEHMQKIWLCNSANDDMETSSEGSDAVELYKLDDPRLLAWRLIGYPEYGEV